MYDRSEIRAETDALWSLIREALADAGITAPERLDRERATEAVWTAPELVLAQTCGLPFSQRLISKVALVGAPAYRISGCAPGSYRSALVVRREDRAEALEDLRGQRAAVNALDSQSGHAALRRAVAPLAQEGRFFKSATLTGAHAASIVAVAEGRADIAAIDAVTWALAERHDLNAGALRVLGWTEETPGLPLITALGRDARAIREAVAVAISAAGEGIRDALLLDGVVARAEADYAPLARCLAEAEALSALPIP